MSLAKLMSFQKQKHTIAKFLQDQIKQKQFFRGGNNRTFITPLVDTR